MSEFVPRPSQGEILTYSGGRLGISAVPGAGKTHTLAELAARLVAEGIADGQEVLIVTLVNSAVDNFKNRINEAVKRRGLLPGFGYRVRTLHGLAHDIVRERPGLLGLSEDFTIVDERESGAIRADAVASWLRGHPEVADAYVSPDLGESESARARDHNWPALVQELAEAFIRRAKDLQLTPAVLSARLDLLDATSHAGGLVSMGAAVYADYQRSLSYRGVVDFDDLIRLALEALRLDPDYCARLREHWPYVLEDEAQDSSLLQEEILSSIVGDGGNWVRVGDPNQAINSTFTTADPELLRRFVNHEQVSRRELRESGRSQPVIVDLANYLVTWVMSYHPQPQARTALAPPLIEPTPPGDPQPNPTGDASGVKLVAEDFTPGEELGAVVESVARWASEQLALEPSSRQTCAVLTPMNERGSALARLLRQRGVPYVELLRSTSETREAAGALGNVLRCLADPLSAHKLSVALMVWRREERGEPQALARLQAAAQQVQVCSQVERYLWPRADNDWLATLNCPGEQFVLLEDFRDVARRWHRAASLPIDQLVLTLAADLSREPTSLALFHKLALLLREAADAHPTYRLPELIEDLEVIARNQRRFIGFASEDSGFVPPRGVVTVATLHKAKGLEWDRVYLTSVNNYDFPSGLPADRYKSEPWFIRGQLNLQAEALAALEAVASSGDRAPVLLLSSGEATQEARLAYVAERLRLLYVGMTRARRDLIMTWNKGGPSRQKLQAAAPFSALQTEWESMRGG